MGTTAGMSFSESAHDCAMSGASERLVRVRVRVSI